MPGYIRPGVYEGQNTFAALIEAFGLREIADEIRRGQKQHEDELELGYD